MTGNAQVSSKIQSVKIQLSFEHLYPGVWPVTVLGIVSAPSKG